MRKTSISLSIFLVFIILIFAFIVRPYRISGDCMEPAIVDGKLYFLNKLYPYLFNYKIGDIIVFNHEGKAWISRVVALEGEVIKINYKSINVNNKKLESNHILRNWENWDYGKYAIKKDFVVSKSHVFVLSDNLSAKHDDSRIFGAISNSSILGVIW